MKKENIYILVAIIFVVFAIASPILFFLFYTNQIGTETLNEMAELGAVGDYIGGTTIALFNISSFSMLVAALVMQKEELKLQREEITKTREEYELTNKTMKKQQFESTFFNMISLHQSISKDITNKDKVFHLFLKDFEKEYNKHLREYMDKQFRTRLFLTYNDEKKFEDMLKTIYFGIELKSFMKRDIFLGSKNPKSKEYKDHVQIWLQRFKGNLEIEFKRKMQDSNLRTEMIAEINYSKLKGTELFIPNLLIFDQNIEHQNLLKKPNHEIKTKAYEKTYSNYEKTLGHYFRNLYRIEKLLSEQGFSFKDRNNYRGIWRAQLSSSELLMLYYNVNFSEKGRKFKTLLLNTGFFDDHIKNEDLIWKNDHELLCDFQREV